MTLHISFDLASGALVLVVLGAVIATIFEIYGLRPEINQPIEIFERAGRLWLQIAGGFGIGFGLVLIGHTLVVSGLEAIR